MKTIKILEDIKMTNKIINEVEKNSEFALRFIGRAISLFLLASWAINFFQEELIRSMFRDRMYELESPAALAILLYFILSVGLIVIAGAFFLEILKAEIFKKMPVIGIILIVLSPILCWIPSKKETLWYFTAFFLAIFQMIIKLTN